LAQKLRDGEADPTARHADPSGSSAVSDALSGWNPIRCPQWPQMRFSK
jgi:hypothetical protein